MKHYLLTAAEENGKIESKLPWISTQRLILQEDPACIEDIEIINDMLRKEDGLKKGIAMAYQAFLNGIVEEAESVKAEMKQWE